MKTPEVVQAIARRLEWWRNTIVPNVYLGSRRDEMDLAVVSKSGLLWEIGIKVSMSDWKADMDKPKMEARATGSAVPSRSILLCGPV